MSRLLILYQSTDGHTRKICQHIQQRVRQLQPAAEISVQALQDYDADQGAAPDAVVLGASIRYGHHHASVLQFIRERQAWLEARPNAFFSVNVVARKPGKDQADTNPYLAKFLQRIQWRPQLLDVFAGRIHYALYGPLDRTMIRFIMWVTKGPTDANADVEFTDWTRVDRFSGRVASLLDKR